MEKLTGDDFLQLGYLSNPRPQAGKGLTETFNGILDKILSQLVLQGDVGQVFEDAPIYDYTIGNFETLGDLSADFLDDLVDIALVTPDKMLFWENVLRIVVNAKGESNMTTADINALDAAIYASDSALSYTSVHASVFDENMVGITTYGDNADNTISGTIKNDRLYGNAGNDTINGDVGDDHIEGDDGNDVIGGGYGDDVIYGGNGNDQLTGHQGGDLIFGGNGDDTYNYNLGDGYDTIRETGNAELNDKIVFGAGIAITDLTFTRLSNNDLSIFIDAAGGQGEIVIENQFDVSSSTGSVETLVFSDTSTFDLTSLNFTLVGTNAAETLHGVTVAGQNADTIYGGGGNDFIYGYIGADTLYGGDGNDTIYGGGPSVTHYGETDSNILHGDAGNDTIYGSYGVDHIRGGTGNDILRGNRGNDEYYFNLGDGNDSIIEVDASGFGVTDTLNLGDGIDTDDVTIIREGSYNLKILINGGQDGSITLVDQFKTSSGVGAVEYIKFHDTTIWDLTTMSFGLVATDAAETIHGNNSGSGSPDDIIYAEGGNDIVYGYLGSDQLHGGDGNDVIHAGTTSSTYYGKTTTNYLYGDAGNDTIYGAYGVDHIYGGSGDDTLLGRLGNDHYYYVRAQGNDIIEDQGAVSGATNIDVIHLDESIDANDLTYVRDGNYNLKVLINGGSGGSITLVDQFTTGLSAKAVEFIQLSNGTQIDLRNMDFVLTATAAAETLYGTEVNSLKNDTIYGGGGNDTISGYLGSDTLYGGDGNDLIYGGGSSGTYFNETDSNYLYGESGTDTIWGSNGVDHIYGGADNDNLNGRLGADQYYYAQGEGDDIITESGKTDIDILNFDSSIEASEISYIRVGNTDLKILINGGSDGSILLSGQFSMSGSDAGVEFIKLDNDTEIDLRTLNYTLTGTSANETLNGTLTYSGGIDTIYGGGGNDTISGYLGSDTLYGGDGNDLIYGGGSSGTYFNETDTNYLYGESGTDTIWGSNGVDHIYGGADNDNLNGRLGADQYYYAQGEGDDIITESGKTDIDILNFDSSIEASEISYIRVGNTDLKILINGGTDGSILLSGQFSVSSSDAGLELIKLHDDTEIDLRTLNYTLTGTSANETLNGTLTYSGGIDTIYGGGGNDTISGYLGSDTLYGGDGNDLIYGGGSSGTYYNETDTNYLYGEAGTDTLYGSNGNDFLYGGDGSDTLTGRNGADTFVFLNGETGVDTITDFNVGQGDALDLSDLLGDFDPLTEAITDFVQITESGGNSALFVDRDGAGSTYGLQQIATIQGVTGLTDEAALYTNGTLLAA
ncbi:hemolysin-type calcium-binding repeat family protein [Micavibrio aeruginosavorus ARL-13]|uniref:Hemolysin-type calcium-binding repeat family protein n=1 Tax=Micavibrio aeruginosavorus (strain ARL-13) TaxID=856793 RepID=G2KSU4_MICAA|nr:hemolysin-type calcium-binding repeat family protein [Micavibrio aeruginosavorus ARL-13]